MTRYKIKKTPEKQLKRVKSGVRKPKPRAPKAENPSPLRREIWGLVLLAVCLVLVISLLSEFLPTSHGNILGPWLGHAVAQGLNTFLGRLPVLFYIAALTVLGYGQVTDKLRMLWRPIVFLLSTGFALAALLSVRLIGRETLELVSQVDLQASGGYLGKLAVVDGIGPLFGNTQFGPYLVFSLASVFLLIWGFRVSVAAWMERGAESAGALGMRVVEGWRARRSEQEGEEEEKTGLTLTRSLPSPKSVKVEKSVPQEDAFEDVTEKAPLKATVKPANKGKGRDKGEGSGNPATPSAEAHAEILDELTPEEIEQLEKLDPEEMDPLLIRKLRDLQLERQRVSELNEWEQKIRNPEISGMLGGRGKKGIAVENAVPPQVPPVLAPGWDHTPGHAGETEADDEGESDTATVGSDGEEEPETAELAVLAPPKPEVQYDDYRIPALDEIFPDPPKQPLEFTEEELREQSKLLEAQLINFKVMGKVTQICPGPVITRYEVELAPGVKVNRIAGLADDLALALRAKSIRILAPIPGKSVVGIEVPNRRAQMVYIKEILAAEEFALEEDSLKVGLGKTIGGEPYVIDLTRAPHLLIAGQTGSGKSVCINSIMASLLVSKTPDDLRMILVDPKVVELKPYDEIPHLLHPVITQPEISVQALKWATIEMDRRYEVLAQSGVRNIKGFNQRFREGRLPDVLAQEDRVKMPYILIVIDELADLMMVAGKEVETSIARIAQKARAVGIHLLLATQRPSTNVITGTIKANLPTRIAFQVASQIDARTIMDKQGAEKLLGRGDMLYKSIDFPEPVRLHGCFLDDEQCEKIAACCSGQFVNYPQVKSFNLDEDAVGGGREDEPRDEMFRDAAELVVQLKQASVSLLQRRLGIGYARSGRLVDQMERAGIVGRERGSKPREVLMNEEELHSFLSSGLND